MTDALSPKWPAATAALVALAEHGISADIGELLARGNPARGVAPGAIFKMIEAIDRALEPVGIEKADFDKLSDEDPAFMAAWTQMIARGYQYSQSNVDKVHLGWMMAMECAGRQNDGAELEEHGANCGCMLCRTEAFATLSGDSRTEAQPADWRDDMLGYAYQFIGSLMELSSDPALSVVLDAYAEPGPGKVDGLPVPGTIKFDQPTSQQLQEIWDWYDEISFARVKAGLPDNMLKFCGVKNGAEEWIVYQDQGGPSLVHGRSAFDALTKLRALRDRLV